MPLGTPAPKMVWKNSVVVLIKVGLVASPETEDTKSFELAVVAYTRVVL